MLTRHLTTLICAVLLASPAAFENEHEPTRSPRDRAVASGPKVVAPPVGSGVH
jgi:hypothetical protein